MRDLLLSSVRWAQWSESGEDEAPRDAALLHPDGRPVSANTMRLRLRSHVERVAWIAEQRAEAAERERQEAERMRRRVHELDDQQVVREFRRLAR